MITMIALSIHVPKDGVPSPQSLTLENVSHAREANANPVAAVGLQGQDAGSTGALDFAVSNVEMAICASSVNAAKTPESERA